MRIRVRLQVADTPVYEDVLTLEDRKVQSLTKEELEAAVEQRVREWADRLIRVEWETEEEGSSS